MATKAYDKIDKSIQKQQETLVEKVVSVNRVAKVVKGGRHFSFSALVVVGNQKGSVGFGFGKANEVADAIKKALTDAKRNIFFVHIKGHTITHEIMGHYGAGKVLLKPAAEGTGVIAGGPVRAMCDCAGIKDILSKCLGTNNVINVVKATAQAFKNLKVERVPPLEEEVKK